MANNNNNNGGGMGFWGMVGAILVALFIFSVIGWYDSQKHNIDTHNISHICNQSKCKDEYCQWCYSMVYDLLL